MASLSSQLISTITAYRNPNGPEHHWTELPLLQRNRANPIRVAIAEVGYIAMVPFAIVETALSLVAALFSPFLPIGEQNRSFIKQWMHSGAFSIAWTTCDAFINVFCNDLIMTESVARACAESGNFLDVPLDALQNSGIN